MYRNNPAELSRCRKCQIIWLQINWRQVCWKQHEARSKQEVLHVFISSIRMHRVNDSVNAEKATEVRREKHIKLDGQPVTSSMVVKSKVQALFWLRKLPIVNEQKIHLDSLKLFNRLIIELSLYSISRLPYNCPCSSTTKKGTCQTRRIVQRQAWRR